MAEPFLGEIRIMSYNFPPKGWAFCNGQVLPINQNQALFSLLGTMYGGNGQTTFALPNLQGRVAMHLGAGHVQGEAAGQESHTLTSAEMPQHTHVLSAASANGTVITPGGNLLAGGTPAKYTAPANLAAMHATTVANAGGTQPHTNMQPYLTVNFSIALDGIFPSRN